MSDNFRLLTEDERATLHSLYRFKLQELVKAVKLERVDAFMDILFGLHMAKARLWIDSTLKAERGGDEGEDTSFLRALRRADARQDWKQALDSFGDYVPGEDEEYVEKVCEQCDVRGKCTVYTTHYRGIDENSGPEPDELPKSIQRIIKTLDFSDLLPGD
ncbi:hypothetical protein LCGC14_1485790 [marine sediment metagenome]|uniref:Uncharacterized protein n=1 Tax=marine sediment metagenome TaxID=412755 RepID=A0A0F9MA36_9ZZZZ